MMVYEDCVTHAISSDNSLPQRYLLVDRDKIIGCTGLITNDFISRMDLYPWICALYVEESYRGNSYSEHLLERAQFDAKQGGFNQMYLCTEHIGFYENFDFQYIGTGYHPWGEKSRIYEKSIYLVLFYYRYLD